MTNISWIFVALAVAWFVQLYLSYYQMRRFYKRVSELRRTHQATTSIGMEGSAWKGRQYAVVVADASKKILAVEQLSGWTIFAKLQPVQGFTGISFDELFDDTQTFPVKQKLLLAIRNAAQHIIKAEQGKKEAEKAKESGIEENAAVRPSSSL